jgi:SAM-dependent methyltransferase
MSENSLKLNLGCGSLHLDGWVNVDNNPACLPDVVCDLNVFPYPFLANHFQEVVLDHVIEHLDDPLAVLQEVYRVCRDGALVTVKAPHFSCNWIHPRHKSAISTKLFDFLDSGSDESYGQVKFKVEKVSLKWMRHTSRGRKGGLFIRVLDLIIGFLANIDVASAERLWCYWVGGFEEVSFSVKVVKKI